MLSLSACYFIATLYEWPKMLPNFITQSELKPIVVRFTHPPALGTRSTSLSDPCLLCPALLHFLIGWKISRHSVSQSEE